MVHEKLYLKLETCLYRHRDVEKNSLLAYLSKFLQSRAPEEYKKEILNGILQENNEFSTAFLGEEIQNIIKDANKKFNEEIYFDSNYIYYERPYDEFVIELHISVISTPKVLTWLKLKI